MIDTVAEHGWLQSTLMIIQLLQIIIQARWFDEPAVTTLPHINSEHLPLFSKLPIALPVLCTNACNIFIETLRKEFSEDQVHQVNIPDFSS